MTLSSKKNKTFRPYKRYINCSKPGKKDNKTLIAKTKNNITMKIMIKFSVWFNLKFNCLMIKKIIKISRIIKIRKEIFKIFEKIFQIIFALDDFIGIFWWLLYILVLISFNLIFLYVFIFDIHFIRLKKIFRYYKSQISSSVILN